MNIGSYAQGQMLNWVNGALGVMDACDVGEDQRPGVMKRGNDGVW